MINTKLPVYGMCIIIAIICGLYIMYNNSKKNILTRDEMIALILYIFLGVVFGAKYFSFITDLKKYNYVFNFRKIGLSSYGAVIGIILMVLLYSKQFKKSLIELLCITVPAVPLMYSIGKIGCFVAGCCYGIRYDGPFSVTYYYSLSAPKGVSLFPIQIVESIIFALIYIYIKFLQKKNISKQYTISITFILCGFFKFVLDFLRNSHINKILSTNQFVSIIFILIGIYMILKKRQHN